MGKGKHSMNIIENLKSGDKKKVAISVIVIIAVLVISIGAVLAFLMDKDSKLNIFSILAEYTVKFDANTGEGEMEDQVISYNVGTNLTANAFTKTDYVFKEWNTEADGTGTGYANSAEVNNLGNITLYAQWDLPKEDVTITGVPEGLQSIKLNKNSTFTATASVAGTWEVTSGDGNVSITGGASVADSTTAEITYTGVTATTGTTVTVKFTPTDQLHYNTPASLTFTVEVTESAQEEPTLTLDKTSVTVNSSSSETATITYDGDGELTATSSDTSIATATISGRTLTINGVGEGTATITVTSSETANYSSASTTCEATVEGGLQSFILPEGLYIVGGTIDTGLVVSDSQLDESDGITDKLSYNNGNQWVWIPVPNDGTGPNYSSVSSPDDTTNIYNALIAYVGGNNGTIRNKTTYVDNWSGTGASYVNAALGMTVDEYNTFKDNKLKSIYKYGGFYAGRYETGYTNGSIRSSASASTAANTPIIKPNAYPYNYVTCKQAAQLARGFSTSSYSADIMLGIEWDLLVWFLGNNSASVATTNNWGNIRNSTLAITRSGAKISTSSPYSSWSAISGNKTGIGLLTIGSSNTACKKNMYDVLGNTWEYTAEFTSRTANPCASRGGGCNDLVYARQRLQNSTGNSVYDATFRISLYI